MMLRIHCVRTVGILLLACLAACSHAKSVEKLDGRDRGATADTKGRPQVTVNPEHPLVVDAPAKFLRPGAGRQLQEALRKKGILTQPDAEALGETTSDALSRFQQENDLAATGFPDAETLRRLDLDPDQIYRSPPSEAEAEMLFRKQASEARQRAAQDDEVKEKK
jgi:hypothetical protein